MIGRHVHTGPEKVNNVRSTIKIYTYGIDDELNKEGHGPDIYLFFLPKVSLCSLHY
jgi:hypothetical protein